MHVFNPSVSLILAAHLVGLCVATPVPAPLASRSQYCTNAPLTVAGNFLPRHSTSSLIWCAPNSHTYILLSSTYSVTAAASSRISQLLLTLTNVISTHMTHVGDGLLRTGEIDFFAGEGVEFHSWNTNNHQQTYGVLMAAVEALKDFMGKRGVVGATFYIYDAGTEVGAGTIG